MKHFLALTCLWLLLAAGARAQDWPVYGGDAGATRYSAAHQIDRTNVAELAVAWTYHTGEQQRRGDLFAHEESENTPILADGKLLTCSPFNRLAALDPTTGRELWTYDPNLSPLFFGAQPLTCRGVAVWHDSAAAPGGACAARVFMATNDARLIAVDEATGKPCDGFGKAGTARQDPSIPTLFDGEYQITSAPTIAGEVPRDRAEPGPLLRR